MKLLKNLLCLLIISSVVTAGTGMAADINIIADYQFDNTATLDVPKNFEYKGKWLETVEDNAYYGKSFRIYSPNEKVYVQVPFSHAENKIVLEAYVKYCDNNTDKRILMLKGNDKKYYETLVISKDGTLRTSDNYKITKINADTWYHFALAVNLKTHRAEVFINRKDYATLNLPETLNAVEAVRFENGAAGLEAEMLIDNLRIYYGVKPADENVFEKAGYTNRRLEKTEEDYKPEPESNNIYLNENCNDYTEGNEGPWTKIPKEGNIIKVADVPNAENKSMMIFQTASDPYFEVSFNSITSKKLVAEAKVMVEDFASEKTLFTMKDSNGAFNAVASIGTDGNIKSYNNRTIVRAKKGEWYNLAVAFDFETLLSDYYLDGQLVLEDIAINNANMADISVLRFQCYSASAPSAIYIDDMRFYDGSKLKSSEELADVQVEVKGTEMFIPEKNMRSRLGDAVAMAAYGKYWYDGHDKKKTDAPSFVCGDTVMVPLRFVIEAFGGSVQWNEESQSALIELDNKKASVKAGDTSINFASKIIKTEEPVTEKNGYLYIPAKNMAKGILNKNLTLTERGLVIFSGNDNKFSLTDDAQDLLYLYNYLYYSRPKAEEILEDIKTKNPSGEHPRVLLRQEDFDRIKQNYETDPTTKKWVDGIKSNVDKNIMNAEPAKYEMPDGLRLTGESQKVQSRVMQLGLLYKLFGEKQYAQRAWEELETAANFKDWNANRHFLDTGEMAAGFGIGYDWFYDYFTPEQRKILVDATVKHGLNPTKSAYNGIGGSAYFVNITNNWNIICNSGAALAALAMADEVPELAGFILERGMESTEYMMSEFFPEGGWYEGVGYWYYQTTYIAYYVTALNTACGTDYGFYDIPGLKNTGYYPIYGQGPAGIFNFHDSSDGFSNAPELFFFAKMNNDANLAKLRMEEMEKHNYAGGVKDLIWYDPQIMADRVDLPLDKTFATAEVGGFRSGWDDNAFYVGFHAGTNNVSHGNLDAGTFVIDALGERWAVELGSDDYNLDGYFGDKRWSYYRMRAEGQNVMVINPSAGADQKITAKTKITSFESKPQGAAATLDLTDAFDEYASSVIRGFKMDDNRRRIVIQDEFDLKAASEIYWHMHTKADITVNKGGDTAVLSLGSKKLWMALDTNIPDAKFSVMAARPLEISPQSNAQNINSGIQKIVVHAKNVTGKSYIAVTFIPVFDMTNARLEKSPYEPIAQWSIPDGVKKVPAAVEICVDGEPIEEYSASRYNYELLVDSDAESIPQISASAEEGMNVEVIQTDKIPGMANVIVTDSNDENNKTIYSISYLYATKIGVPENLRAVNPSEIIVSDEPEPQNHRGNLNDGDINTRWSANGIHTALYTFDKPYKINAVALSFYLGSQRTTKFDIEVSKDGENWITVFTGSSCGKTDEYETVSFDEIEAKYVRFRGYGNSQHSWTSVNEMKVYGK